MKLFSMKGRMNRAHYLLHSFGSFVVGLVLIAALAFMAEGTAEDGVIEVFSFVVFFVGIVALGISEVCVTVRRLHDLDRNGSQYFLLSIPFYNIYLGCVLLFKRGTVGPNSYGEDPVPLPFHERPVEAIAR